MSTAHRYRLEPLFALMGMTPHAACTALRLSGSTERQYRSEGVTEYVADRLAVTAGFATLTVWPEMADHVYDDIKRACAECGALFVPYRPSRDRFCSPLCGRRYRQRARYERLRTDPAFLAAERERARVYRASLSPRARQRELQRLIEWEAAR